MNSQGKSKEIVIDILKVIGLLLIILAHISTNPIINQIRSFDVPLLVIISGMLSVKSFNKCTNVKEYYKKRVARLLIPTYIFIILYFLLVKVLKMFVGDFSYKTDWNSVIRSFLLMDGIGYVWIIRVYLLTALSTPLLIKMKEKLNTKIYFSILILIYILYEFTFIIFGNSNYFLQYILYYIIPYGIILAIGIEISDNKVNNKKIQNVICISFGIIYLICIAVNMAIKGEFVYTSQFKYPPRIYYISYAIFVSILLIILISKIKIYKLSEKFVYITRFISRHSLWIYFWHVIYISLLQWSNIHISQILEYIIIVIISVLTTILQNSIIDKIEKNKRIGILKYLKC